MRPSVAERIYALSLYLYPPSFRREFGEAMRQAFRDRLHERRVRSSPLFFDIMSDTVSAVAREHSQAPEGLLRIFVLLTLMFAATTIFVRGESLRTALVDAVVARQESARKAAFGAYERAVHDYDASIAVRYATHAAARSQLVAAQFFGGDVDFFDVHFVDDVVAQPAQLAAVSMDNALRVGWDDPVVLWNAIAMCPSSSTTCHSREVLAHLQSIAPENGAVWWLEFVAADRAKDPNRARNALAKLAAAREFSVYENVMTALWIDAYASLSPPSALSSIAPEMASSSTEVVASGLHARLSHLEWPVAAGKYAFERTCGSPDEALRDDCLRAAGLLATSDIFSARLAGLRTLARLDPSVASAYRAEWRQTMWSRTRLWNLLYRADRNDAPPDTQRWLAVLREHGNAIAAARAVTAASTSPHPPAGWSDGWDLQ
jgi:hypothetical protein